MSNIGKKKPGFLLEVLWNDEKSISEVSVEDVLKCRSAFELIDVRNDEEWTGELNHIKGSKLITLGADLSSFLSDAPKEKTYVFICRSGKRSATATLEAKDLGFENIYNMRGGMIQWNKKEFPTE